ncbi:NUDIX hydrolase [Elusimicrobiota bacterium]
MIKKKKGMSFEYSSGGMVYDAGKVLLIKVENLEGKQVWTFPKGHIETGEDARMAALREVEEETGYICEIMSELPRTSYHFMDKKILVRKTVRWFLMRKLQKKEVKTKNDILKLAWKTLDEAENIATYPSDLHLIDAAQKEVG